MQVPFKKNIHGGRLNFSDWLVPLAFLFLDTHFNLVFLKIVPQRVVRLSVSVFVHDCTSPLAVMTIVGLHDFVKVSISASLKSFLLTMCIDAPESTTNSRSSGLRVDAGRHLFSEGEKNHAPLILTHFWPVSTLLRGHLALATLSPLETDPQILERWGHADEVHLGKYIRAKDFGLEFQCDVQ